MGVGLTVSEPRCYFRHKVFNSTSERPNPPLLIVEVMGKMWQPAFAIIALMVRRSVGPNDYFQRLIQQHVAIGFDDQLVFAPAVLFFDVKYAIRHKLKT